MMYSTQEMQYLVDYNTVPAYIQNTELYVMYLQGCSQGRFRGFGRTPSLQTMAMNYVHIGS